MKNNKVKVAIAITAVAGYAFLLLGVKQMSASVTITFIFCWTAFILVLLFAFSPEISRLVFNKNKLELDRYKKRVDKALVEYDEFKKTVYPLLKITLSEIAFDNYLGVPTKPDDLIDFLHRVENLSSEFKNDVELQKAIMAVKVKIVATFNDQLAFMREKNGLKMDSDKYVTINYPDFDSDDELTRDDVGVDFEGLNNSANEFTDLAEKARYKRKIRELKKFYKENIA